MMIETKRLKLKLISKEDAEKIVLWRNKKRIIDSLFNSKGLTIDQHLRWYDRYINDDSRIEFVITKKEDNKRVGTIGLSHIDNINQKAEYGILIGEEEELGKGYAKESTIAIINYGFNELNLKKIYLNVFKDNMKAISLYEKIGFIEEGIFNKEIFKNGEFKDIVRMAIFRKDIINEKENSYKD